MVPPVVARKLLATRHLPCRRPRVAALRRRVAAAGGGLGLGLGLGVGLAAATHEPARAEGCECGWAATLGVGAAAVAAAAVAVRSIQAEQDTTLHARIAAAHDATERAAAKAKTVVAEVARAEDRHRARGRNGGDHQVHADRLGKALHGTKLEELVLSRDTLGVMVLGAVAVGIVTGVVLYRIKVGMVRFKSVEDIPSSYFAVGGTKSNGKVIRGKVASVTDGDTFRLWHKPAMNDALDQRAGKLSETSLPVRIAGMDTPETAKFGKEGQPFAQEAKEELARLLEAAGSSLKVRPQSTDHFGRAVCLVSVGRWPFTKDVAEVMLQKGLATVYRQAGAQYGGKLERYEQLEAAAKKQKVGMWSLGSELETAAEYKKRTAA